jgi:hypothetical protein
MEPFNLLSKTSAYFFSGLAWNIWNFNWLFAQFMLILFQSYNEILKKSFSKKAQIWINRVTIKTPLPLPTTHPQFRARHLGAPSESLGTHSWLVPLPACYTHVA